jgi:hypothetical protein
MRDPLAPRQFVLAQNLKAGWAFVHGQSGRYWTALADADTNMRRHTRTGELPPTAGRHTRQHAGREEKRR